MWIWLVITENSVGSQTRLLVVEKAKQYLHVSIIIYIIIYTNTCTHIEFCFANKLVQSLIFIRESVLVEPQCWEATWSNQPWGFQTPKTSNTCIWALLALIIMINSNSAHFLECYLLQTVVFNYCLLNIFANTQSISYSIMLCTYYFCPKVFMYRDYNMFQIFWTNSVLVLILISYKYS